MLPMHRLQYGISSVCIQEPHQCLGMVNIDHNSSKKVANTIHDRITRKDPQPSPGASIVKGVHNHAYDEYLAITGFH